MRRDRRGRLRGPEARRLRALRASGHRVARLGNDGDAVYAAWHHPPAVASAGSADQDGGGGDDDFYQYTLTTHVLVLGIDSKNDRKNAKYVREWLSAENRMDFEDLDRYLEISAGVNAYAWPKHLKDAEYAVRDLEKALEADGRGKTLGDLYYAGALAEARANGGALPAGWDGALTHHVGCMYAHMYQWQYAWDKKWENTIVLESDAPWSISVPAFSFQDIVNHQPFDYDVIFLTHGDAVTGDYLYSFDSHGPEYDSRIHMYRWNQIEGAAGLQGYIINRRFKKKLEDYVVQTGGMDMVDAWLMVKVCGSKVKNAEGEDVYALNCYHATPTEPPMRDVILRDADVRAPDESWGYVRLGKYDGNSYPEEFEYDFREPGKGKATIVDAQDNLAVEHEQQEEAERAEALEKELEAEEMKKLKRKAKRAERRAREDEEADIGEDEEPGARPRDDSGDDSGDDSARVPPEPPRRSWSPRATSSSRPRRSRGRTRSSGRTRR